MDAAISAISLFNFAIDTFKNIQLARQFEKRFGSYQLKLDIIQVRLSRWGQVAVANETLTVEGKGEDVEGSPPSKAKTILSDIEDLLYIAQREAKDIEEQMKGSNSLLDPNAIPRDLQKIRSKLHQFLQKRNIEAVKAYDGLKWSFYKKEQFEEFIKDISEHVAQLETIFPPEEHKKLVALSTEECKDIGKTNLKSLKNVAQDTDPWLEKAVQDELKKKSGGESYTITMSHVTGIGTEIHHGDVKGVSNGNGNTTDNNWN
ncbi:prion-inhibition and propagation-domain-containing protein [Phyllosticta citriasiana]|uniref:Prion-inhibition and propagation-domain-containing protein n=1 Tax=Phyllosticta citriasiana TaxID=595635 RepID=A0ABR1KWH2_9PEZI